MSPELWDAVLSGDHMELHALVVFAGSDSRNVDSFKPIRTGRVSEIEISGEMLMLELSLGGFSPDHYGTAWEQISFIAKNAPGDFAKAGPKTGFFLQVLESVPTNVCVNESVEAWENVADAFFQIDRVGHVPFLYLMDGATDPAFGRMRSSGELIVESGANMSWNIHTKSAPVIGSIVRPIGEIFVDAACQPMKMLTSRRVRIDSQRDMRRMSLSCAAGFRATGGHLSVRVVIFKYKDDSQEVQGPANRDAVTLSRHDVPVRAGRMLPLLASVAAAAAAGIAVADRASLNKLNVALPLLTALAVFLSLIIGFRGKSSS
ncbi:hypothetical protein [Xanthomonas arboricola]|uniref:hypothetical protein n=1 Tax=Xanthomonas arboricola TaxID=56448 RepID=UPI0011B05162|nr:hypothetical protein [Xanthomonas arboricola]